MKSVEYLNVRVDVVEKVGVDAAWVYAYLRYVVKTTSKDSNGFFSLDSARATTVLGINRRQFVYARDKLVKFGLVEHISGANQNSKPRYKLL